MTDLYPELTLQDYVAQIPPAQDPVKTDKHLAGIAVGIGGAFIAYRSLVASEAAGEPFPIPGAAKALLDKIWNKVAPMWLKIAVPVIVSAYQYGNTANVSYDELALLATDYATSLGDYLHTSSTEAVLEGFNAQLNAGWSESLAWKRAAEAYGLDKQQMRSYVKSIAGLSKEQYQTDIIPAASRALLDKALLVRAELVGTNEAYTAAQTGKALTWMIAQARGDLPADTMKKWITAHDERVCPACGPLDQQTVLLHQKFKNKDAEFIGPGVHPNCRCMLELVYPEFIQKDMPGDPFDRDRRGRFAPVEQRSPKPSIPRMPPTRGKPVMEREPEVEKPEEKVAEKVEAPNPFAPNPFARNPFTSAAAAVNPFAVETPNPFTVVNPFEAAVTPVASIANPFIPNPFAPNIPSIPKQKIYVVHRLIRVPGEPPRIFEGEIVPPGDSPQDATIYVDGYSIFSMFNAAGAPEPHIRPGAVIDLDKPQQYDGIHRFIYGHNEDLGGDKQHGLGLALNDANDWSTYRKEGTGLTVEEAEDRVREARVNAHTIWTLESRKYVRDLSDEDIDDIYTTVGAAIINNRPEGGKISLPWGFNTEDIPLAYKQDYMIERLEKEEKGEAAGHWLKTYLEYMENKYPTDELQEANDKLLATQREEIGEAGGMDSTSSANEAPPIIFRFNGFYGDWEKQMQGAEFDPHGIPRGRYMVESPGEDDPIHVMSIDQLPPGLIEDLGGRSKINFTHFRIVDLTPLDRSSDVEKKLVALFRRSV